MIQELFKAHTVSYTLPSIIGSVAASIILGLVVAMVYMYRNTYS